MTRVFGPQAVAFEKLRHWASPRTGIGYPVEWRVHVGPRQFHLQPLMDDQELDGGRSTGAVYWEGAARVAEAGHEVRRGDLEMTGYGERIRVGLPGAFGVPAGYPLATSSIRRRCVPR